MLTDLQTTQWIATLRLQVAHILHLPLQAADELCHAATLLELTQLHYATFAPPVLDRPARMKQIIAPIYDRLNAAA